MVRLHAVALAALALMAAGPAGALMVDPATGGSGYFFWDDSTGSSVSFGDPNDDSQPVAEELLVTLAEDSTIGFFSVSDLPAPGDSFSLVIERVEGTERIPQDSAWTNFGFDTATSLFEAERLDFSLSAGTYAIDLTVDTTASGFDSGAGSWSMSAAVPEPSSAILACVGALVLRGALRQRRAGS